MIRDEAEKLSGMLGERLAVQAPGVVCEVESTSNQLQFHAPGGGRPMLVRYKIRIRDEARVGRLGLDEAQELLAALDAAGGGWGPDRVFEEVAARGEVAPAE